MEHHDKQAIEGLFGKLADAGRAQPYRDPEAEALIKDLIARNPGAAYYMAQTVIVQEQALNAAQAEMEQVQQGRSQQGGLFGRLFGGAQPQAARSTTASPSARQDYGQQGHEQPAQPQRSAGPWGSGRSSRGGGGFMAGAAQTAMGVAGGVLLGNAIGSMMAGPADAAEALPGDAPLEDEPRYDDAGFDDGGFEE